MRDLIYMANSRVGQGRRDRDPDLIWSRFVDTRQIFFVCAKKTGARALDKPRPRVEHERDLWTRGLCADELKR